MKNQKLVRTSRIKRLMLAILVTSSIMAASIVTLYLDTRVDMTASLSQCESAGHSTSADGAAVVNEADLGCLGESQRLLDSKQNKEMVALGALIIGVISFLSNIAFIIHAYRRV